MLLLLVLVSHGMITGWLLLAAAGVQKLAFNPAAIEEGINKRSRMNLVRVKHVPG